MLFTVKGVTLAQRSRRTLDFMYATVCTLTKALPPNPEKILHDVKEFQRAHEFKYVWTKQGKVLLKKV
jgi:hypothetical protein